MFPIAESWLESAKEVGIWGAQSDSRERERSFYEEPPARRFVWIQGDT